MVQAFVRGAVPARVGDITIQITASAAPDIPAGTNPKGAVQQTPRGAFYLQLQDANGVVVHNPSGDLVPQLTPAFAQGLVDLMQYLRTKAVAEVL